MQKNKNKIVILTGGSGLIGASIATKLIKDGAICINADIVNSRFNSASTFIECDITSEQSIKNLINVVLAKYGQIDALINNAYPRTSDWGTKFELVEQNSWKQNIDFQLNSYFNITQQVALKMIQQKSGTILNIASIYGSLGPDFTVYEGTDLTSPVAYSAIKGGIINLTRYLASYLGKYGIRVNSLSPGGIFDNQPEAFVKNYEKKVPLKRMGNPDDISPVACFLISNEARYITGQNIIVDGGWSCV